MPSWVVEDRWRLVKQLGPRQNYAVRPRNAWRPLVPYVRLVLRVREAGLHTWDTTGWTVQLRSWPTAGELQLSATMRRGGKWMAQASLFVPVDTRRERLEKARRCFGGTGYKLDRAERLLARVVRVIETGARAWAS